MVRDLQTKQLVQQKYKRVGMIAAGSGITPMFQLIQTISDAGAHDTTSLSLIGRACAPLIVRIPHRTRGATRRSRFSFDECPASLPLFLHLILQPASASSTDHNCIYHIAHLPHAFLICLALFILGITFVSVHRTCCTAPRTWNTDHMCDELTNQSPQTLQGQANHVQQTVCK